MMNLSWVMAQRAPRGTMRVGAAGALRQAALVGMAGFALQAFGQVPGIKPLPNALPAPLNQTLTIKPAVPVQPISQPGLNITKWGIAERNGSQTHAKTGETLFIEGRDLNPSTLVVETRLGAKSIRFPRKAGGTSGRVEFTVPPEAVTGDITVTLQAVGNGNAVLSSAYGVCDRPKITRVFSPLGYRIQDSAGEQEFLTPGRVFTMEGECLHEIELFPSRSDFAGAIQVGSNGTLALKRLISKSYNKVEFELHSVKFFGAPSRRAEGPLKLRVPQTGPSMVVDEERNLFAQTPPPAAQPTQPAPLVPITIQSVESNTSWGTRRLPFVVVSAIDQAVLQNPFRVDSQIKVIGQNLGANPGTTWSIGSVTLQAPNVNGMTTLPPNAVTGQVCAVRRDGVRSCAPLPTTVVASPKITAAPAGWPLLGTIDNSQKIEVPIRKTLTLNGFDLKPPPGLGMEAVVDVTNFDHAAAAACDLELQVQRFDNNTLSFSFGTPGGTRPASCTQEQESRVNFLVTPGGFAELNLKWIYQGDPGATQQLRWKLHATP